MRVGVKIDWILIGAVAILGCGAPQTRAERPATQPPSAVEREYKLSLDPASLADAEGRAALYRAVAGPDVPLPEDPFDTKKCRRFTYLDTDDGALYRAIHVLRIREWLGDKKCESDDVVRSDMTLKARGELDRLGPILDAAWAQGLGIEEDVIFGSDHESGWSAFSIGASRKGERPADVAGLRATFEGALPGLPGDQSLSAGCRSSHERRWELKLEVPEGASAPEIALWYWPGRQELELAELSFAVALADAEALAWAEKLKARLLAGGVALVPARSKTEALYACSPSTDGPGSE